MKAILILFICLPGLLFAQKQFRYKRSVNGAAGWNTITIPDAMFKNINRDFSDIRLYSIHGSDSTEVPYIIGNTEEIVTEESKSLAVVNRSFKNGKQYFTFELEGRKMNYLDLELVERNYVGSVKIEGSHDQGDWFEIEDEMRIVSIQDADVDFTMSTLNFPLSNYRFLRISIGADRRLNLVNATFKNKKIKNGSYHLIPSAFTTQNNKTSKATTINITLPHFQPVSQFSFDLSHPLDYYRQYTIEYVYDSSKSEKGWIKHYQNFANGYFTSFLSNKVSAPMILAKEFRVTIQNNDNTPLAVNGLSVSGPDVNITAKLPGNNVILVYGNSTTQPPSYDLTYFQDKIPATPALASLGQEENISIVKASVNPLLENPVWLWSAIFTVMGVLGFFTMKMMKNK